MPRKKKNLNIAPKPKLHMRDKSSKPKYPSPYGSHIDMVVSTLTDTASAVAYHDYNMNEVVICQDERGPYVTFKKQLDSGLKDLNRCASVDNRNKFLEKFGIKEKSKDNKILKK